MKNSCFIKEFKLSPYNSKNGQALLSGLIFAVKDNIDVKNFVSSCGNPVWEKSHPPALANAICVDQLLAEGATCVGKTVCGELGLGLTGVNQFYGTALNPKAPDCVPGGSSSGSASAVASKKVHFSLGTDTGGSVRVPASYCGVYGFRSSHGLVCLAGINLLSPTFDIVGIFSESLEIISKVAHIFFPSDINNHPTFKKIYINQTVSNSVDLEVKKIFDDWVEDAEKNNLGFIDNIRNIQIDEEYEIVEKGWSDTFKIILCTEIWNSVGSWVEYSNLKFRKDTHIDFLPFKNFDREKISEAFIQRRKQFIRINNFLNKNNLMCFPTIHNFPPKLSEVKDIIKNTDYKRMRNIQCISCIGGLPQITIPINKKNSLPVGISLVAAHKNDHFLLNTAKKLLESMEDKS